MSDWRDVAYQAQQDAEREWIEEGGAEARAQADIDRVPRSWAVRLICCGHEWNPKMFFKTWEEADAFREEWRRSGAPSGHERQGIVEEALR